MFFKSSNFTIEINFPFTKQESHQELEVMSMEGTVLASSCILPKTAD